MYLYNIISKKKINDVQDFFFTIVIVITYILIIISSLGLSNSAPTFLSNMDYYVRIYICLFLIWRFNPITHNHHFTDLDRKIAFSAGIFILTTTVLNDYLNSFKDKVKGYFHKN